MGSTDLSFHYKNYKTNKFAQILIAWLLVFLVHFNVIKTSDNDKSRKSGNVRVNTVFRQGDIFYYIIKVAAASPYSLYWNYRDFSMSLPIIIVKSLEITKAMHRGSRFEIKWMSTNDLLTTLQRQQIIFVRSFCLSLPDIVCRHFIWFKQYIVIDILILPEQVTYLVRVNF